MRVAARPKPTDHGCSRAAAHGRRLALGAPAAPGGNTVVVGAAGGRWANGTRLSWLHSVGLHKGADCRLQRHPVQGRGASVSGCACAFRQGFTMRRGRRPETYGPR